jgi:hypothetical protein
VEGHRSARSNRVKQPLRLRGSGLATTTAGSVAAHSTG